MANIVDPKTLGIYVVAANVGQVTLVLPNAIRLVLLPKIAALPTPEQRSQNIVAAFRGFWPLFLLGSVLAAPLVYFGTAWVYGGSFRDAAAPSLVLLCASVLMGGKDMLASGAKALGEPGISSKAEAVAVAFSIVLLLAFLSRYGIWAACFASLVAYGCAFAIMVKWMTLRAAVGWLWLLNPIPQEASRRKFMAFKHECRDSAE